MHPTAPPGFAGEFLTAESRREPYGTASGPVRVLPAAVARPRGLDDVVRLMEWAGGEGVSLVPRGAGTGMPGGNVGAGVSVDFAALDQVSEPDLSTRTIRVGPGAVAQQVARAAEAVGLYFPPLPSSADRCTLGGMVANNAAGARSFLHGAVREWIEELEVVLPGGMRVRMGPHHPLPPSLSRLHDELLRDLGRSPAGWPSVRKNSSGYALDRFLPTGDGAQLLTGSEGTLGVVTEVVLRLVERPEARGVVLLGLPGLHDLPGAAARAAELGAGACEYFGRRILEMAELDRDEDVGELARGSEALLLLEMEGSPETVRRGLAGAKALADDLGSPWIEARDEEARLRLWDVRHRASPTIERAAERGLRSTQFIEDCVVPVPRLADFVERLGKILDDADTDAVIFGHAGDGNLHVNPLVDLSRDDWKERVRRVLDRTADLVAGLGGTLSGEHGDGRIRAPLLDRIWPGELVGAFRRVKDGLDPGGILNPGVILPLPGQDPLEGLEAQALQEG